MRGLWKTSDSAEGDIEIATTQFDDDLYVDNPNLTSIYTEPDGTRAWVRGFGGSMSPYDTGGAYGKRGLSSTTMSTTTSIPPMAASLLVSTPH